MFSSSVMLPFSLIFASCERQTQDSWKSEYLFRILHEYWLVTILIRKCFRLFFFCTEIPHISSERENNISSSMCVTWSLLRHKMAASKGLLSSLLASAGSLISVPAQWFLALLLKGFQLGLFSGGNQRAIDRNRKVNVGAQFNGGRTQQRYLLFRAMCSVEIKDLFHHDALSMCWASRVEVVCWVAFRLYKWEYARRHSKISSLVKNTRGSACLGPRIELWSCSAAFNLLCLIGTLGQSVK